MRLLAPFIVVILGVSLVATTLRSALPKPLEVLLHVFEYVFRESGNAPLCPISTSGKSEVSLLPGVLINTDNRSRAASPMILCRGGQPMVSVAFIALRSQRCISCA